MSKTHETNDIIAPHYLVSVPEGKTIQCECGKKITIDKRVVKCDCGRVHYATIAWLQL